MINWDALSRVLAGSVNAIQERAARVLIEAELARLDHEEVELIQKYRMLSARELEEAMQAQRVPEHPSWEDLIHWEAIEDQRKALKEILCNLSERDS